MGRFFNPGNSAFKADADAEIYVDKTGLLNFTNRVINTNAAFICNSRPRRFGKSVTANMLTAYYSKDCDSEEIFAGLEISDSPDFKKHMNQYDVIHFDVQWCIEAVSGPEDFVTFITRSIIEELSQTYTEILTSQVKSLPDALSLINARTGTRFVIIIDEWDVLIRDEVNNKEIQDEYINFLRGIFKGIEPTKYIALAYLTGILPIKRLKTQSALNNFDEFTMIDSGNLASYIGFTETEVKGLCAQYERDYAETKRWYDGYFLSGQHIYNPKAVVSLMLRGGFQSYWSQTGTYEAIQPFINMNFDGLRTAIMAMLSGDAIKVKTTSYQNDMVTFKNKDDVLTLLIHLGYLAYNQQNQTAYIPNEEIRGEFMNALEEDKWDELHEFERKSEELLNATLDLDSETVASVIEQIHTEYASTIQYNDENSLSSVLTIAYLSSVKYYFKPVRELPTGRGFADFVFIPKPEYLNSYPAMVVELKWNQNAQTALKQIKEKKYTDSLLQYTGNILLVGINYDKKNKSHECVIEEDYK